MIFLETPANPTLRLTDIGRCARVAGRYSEDRTDEDRVLLAVDNTFLGPLWQHPLDHGADLVLYSLTKYVGGHSDVIAGACLGSEELLSAVKGTRTFLGTMGGPWTGWLLMRSLETLKLRMTCQMKNARYVADYLSEHPATMTHADIEPADQRRMGITPAMVRLSIGVEDPEDLIADVERALETV